MPRDRNDMSTEPDVAAMAKTLVEQHGVNAEVVAYKSHDENAENGDMDAVLFWKRTLAAVRVLVDEAD